MSKPGTTKAHFSLLFIVSRGQSDLLCAEHYTPRTTTLNRHIFNNQVVAPPCISKY